MHYKKLDQAIQFAAKWHAGQERDGENPLPYVTHPVEVVVNLRHVGQVVDEYLLCAAALHDVIEETDATLDQVEDGFGVRVRQLVAAVTREEPTKKETAGMSKEEIWQLRTNLLMEEIAGMTPEAQSIKLADRLANVRDGKRTRHGEKLDRYLGQTVRMLSIIPKEVNWALWTAILNELPADLQIRLG